MVEANGDMFTLRWRDYPRARRFARHRLRLALLYPGPKPGGVAALRNRTRQSSLATVKNALINDPSFEELLRPGAIYS